MNQHDLDTYVTPLVELAFALGEGNGEVPCEADDCIGVCGGHDLCCSHCLALPSAIENAAELEIEVATEAAAEGLALAAAAKPKPRAKAKKEVTSG